MPADANPDAPEIEASDVEAWNFYWRNATAFVREFGLMPGRLAATGYEGVAEEIFLTKLSAVHDMVAEKAAAMAKEDAEEKPEIIIAGAENG